MRKKRKWLAYLLATTMAFTMAGCGGTKTQNTGGATEKTEQADDSTISKDSPYYGKGYNFAEKEKIVMYVLGDTPKDMQKVLDKANSEYFEPNLNTTLDVKFLNWSYI